VTFIINTANENSLPFPLSRNAPGISVARGDFRRSRSAAFNRAACAATNKFGLFRCSRNIVVEFALLISRRRCVATAAANGCVFLRASPGCGRCGCCGALSRPRCWQIRQLPPAIVKRIHKSVVAARESGVEGKEDDRIRTRDPEISSIAFENREKRAREVVTFFDSSRLDYRLLIAYWRDWR